MAGGHQRSKPFQAEDGGPPGSARQPFANPRQAAAQGGQERLGLLAAAGRLAKAQDVAQRLLQRVRVQRQDGRRTGELAQYHLKLRGPDSADRAQLLRHDEVRARPGQGRCVHLIQRLASLEGGAHGLVEGLAGSRFGVKQGPEQTGLAAGRRRVVALVGDTDNRVP
jgi:hypothetical protein